MINVEQNSLYGGKLYDIYIVLRFIVKIWDGSNNQKGKRRIRCNNLSGFLDSLQITLKTKRLKTFRAILQAIKKHIASLEKDGLQISLLHIKGCQDDAEKFKI